MKKERILKTDNRHDYEHPALIVHKGPKTADEFREAMTWLKERGFKGHFFDVPPEVLDDFQEVSIESGTDGFYFKVKDGNLSLWAPLNLGELTEKQRKSITEKYGKSPEKVCAEVRKKAADSRREIETPVTDDEKQTAFKIIVHDVERPAGLREGWIEYMWPSVSPWYEQTSGVKGGEFMEYIRINFHGKDETLYPIVFEARVPEIEQLIKDLQEAIVKNKKECERRKKED